ncbi:MAG: TadE/TadG family type IV pilus assembly protein [Terracidiphilus sp.]
MRGLKRFVGNEDGAELLEFALAATMFTMMLFGVMQFSLGVYAANQCAIDAQLGARYAMVHGSDWANACATTTSVGCYTAADGSGVKAYILSLPHPGPGFTGANNQIVVTPLTTTVDGVSCVAWSRGCRVEVNVKYIFGINLPIFPQGWNALSATFKGDSIETIQD